MTLRASDRPHLTLHNNNRHNDVTLVIPHWTFYNNNRPNAVTLVICLFYLNVLLRILIEL